MFQESNLNTVVITPGNYGNITYRFQETGNSGKVIWKFHVICKVLVSNL